MSSAGVDRIGLWHESYTVDRDVESEGYDRRRVVKPRTVGGSRRNRIIRSQGPSSDIGDSYQEYKRFQSHLEGGHGLTRQGVEKEEKLRGRKSRDW